MAFLPCHKKKAVLPWRPDHNVWTPNLPRSFSTQLLQSFLNKPDVLWASSDFLFFRMQTGVSAAISALVAEQKVQHKKQCELDNLVTILCEQNAQLLERVTDLENERQKREVFTEKILLPAIAKLVAQTDPEPLDQIGLRTVFESLKE
jgi:hypothetical protein